MTPGEQPSNQSLQEEGNEPAFTLDALPTAPRSARRRAVALTATALLVVAVLVGLFLRSTSDPGGAFDTLLQIYTPTPQPTFVPGANLVYIMRGVPWGVLTIDGKQIPQDVAIIRGVSLTYGTHHFVYQARYFSTLRCDISAPRQPEDSCPIDGPQGESGQFISDHGLARMIDLNMDSSKLQADQFTALEQQINHMLSAKLYRATIVPGDRYINGQGALTTAAEPLTLSLQLHLDPLVPGDSTASVGALCLQLCALPNFGDPGSLDDQWRVTIQAGERWSLTDAHGHTTAMVYPSLGASFAQSTLYIGVTLNASGWSISGLDHPDSDALVDNAHAALLMTSTRQTLPQPSTSLGGFSFIFGANPMDGCILNLTIYPDLASNTSIQARVLWRFGALVALDAAAHKFNPTLPVANAAEQAAASLILQQAQGAG